MSVNKTIVNELLEHMETGSSRKVFAIKFDPETVVKVCTHRIIQNVLEFDIWVSFSETEEGKKWLAPCYTLSDDGRVLTQERLAVINDIKDPRLPKKVPNFMTDLKVQNWGAGGKGNVKCCDYGSTLILQDDPWKMKEAKWWSDNTR